MRYFPPSALPALGLACLFLAQPALADPAEQPVNQNAFILGGQFSTGWFQDTFRFWEDHYEPNFLVGFGYQYFFYTYPAGFQLGAEAGLGVRGGEHSSAELWGGLVARYDGLIEAGGFSVSPAITFGLSAVTGTVGVETQRAADINRSVPILYYLGPEIAISHEAFPDLELLARVQHRSGGFGTIAPIDGSNAATLGLRYKF